ncbi:hypothetical protein [Streptomyces fildesensis]|uniref:hypothetical protein n=1 Tax=Streptomyces fildesensis TaxID=375757 RepID=UPI0018DFC240|nr:hypothetical protein [Streptomyces fildesensis]
MRTIDRQLPAGEAQFAILEAALQLLRLNDPSSSRIDVDEIDLLREALGATRAAVLATHYALVRTTDAHRMLCSDDAPVNVRAPDLHVTSAERE